MFEALAGQLPSMQFVWLDVEDQEDVVGDLDIVTFPSVLVGHGDQPVFLGPLLPQIGILQRMLERFASSDTSELPPGDTAHALLASVRQLLAARA